ncbi:fluoride efflux transporter CrcB [Halobacillus campisalis]|uniref:Fluoride-specific ion channel FluC n=1 Tax=Halobacillus campisalis TaxID=435909 RepID=A0ABW2K5W9_9BACI|nr:fluoride efflux transporter CrcB [Halobacillus campisalis]
MMTLSVLLGGMIGAIMRFELSRLNRLRVLPWGTFIANATGGLLLGLLIRNEPMIPEWLWLLLGVGFCGSYTTFSTFSYEVIELIQKKYHAKAAFYMISSVVVTISGCYVIILF